MRSQLFEHAIDLAHADELMTRLGLPEGLDGEPLGRVSSTHGG
jgi:hypothetical protein